MKAFYDALKADLEKPEDQIFNNEISRTYMVREARNHNRVHNLFNVVCQKLSNSDAWVVSRA